MNKRWIVKLVGGLMVAAMLTGAGRWAITSGRIPWKKEVKVETPKNKYVDFTGEVYDKIKLNYWDKVNDKDLVNLYWLGVNKLTEKKNELTSEDKEGVKKLVEEVIRDLDEEKKKELVATLADIVLANLKPFGRSRLYSVKQQKELANTVNNVDPGSDLYQVLGVKKEATEEEIVEAYEEKIPQVTAVEEKQKVERAKEVLADTDNRKNYDSGGVEPTIKYQVISPGVFWLWINKFSPTTWEEFGRVTAKADSGNELKSLVLDLRDNVGGAIDYLPYFLGPFIGNDSYAYQFFHQGEKTDFKTKTGWMASLIRYKKVVILINENTQSSAELMASTLKKYNVGLVVGKKSKGWGTIENVFPLETQIDENEKYSLFLVHSLSVRDDGESIEGNGVEPVIDMDRPEWKSEMMDYFGDRELVGAVEKVWKKE